MASELHRERVLVIDDEPQVLTALRDSLGDWFDVISVAEPEQALDLAANDPELAVVICDQRMAKMPGDELLHRLRQVSNATRFMITGHADVHSVARAINQGNVFAFITKPWDTAELVLRVRQAAEVFRLNRELNEERNLASALLASTPDAIYLKDRQHRFTRVNDAFIQLVEAESAEDVVGRRRGELTAPNPAAERLECIEDEILADGLPRRDILHEQPTSAGLRMLSTTKAPLRTPGGEVLGVVCISRDVTESVQAQRALARSEERQRLALRAAGAGLFDVNLETGEVQYSPSPPKPDDRLVTANFATLLEERLHPDDLASLDFALKAHLQVQQPFRSLEVRSKNAQGDYRWFRIDAQASWDAAGRPQRLVGAFIDIDELRRTQAKLLQAQKLEAIGQLAAGVAHEINTPAQYVSDNVAFLQRGFLKLSEVISAYRTGTDAAREATPLAPDLERLDALVQSSKLDYLMTEIPRALAQSLEGLLQVTSIVRAMKEFSHPSGHEKEPTDINAVIRSTCTVARNEWKYVANLDLDLDPDLPHIPGLRNELSQVFLNLIVNASHAIAVARPGADKGTIKISTRSDPDAVEIRVIDDGCGIPEAARARVFEPFFTTKEVGKGTGQGLAISYSVVVDKHHGTIRFETDLRRGTTFVVRLPRAAGASSDEPEAN